MSINETAHSDAEILQLLLAAMNKTDADGRARLLRTLQAFYGLHENERSSESGQSSSPRASVSVNDGGSTSMPSFSEDRSPSPKEFLLEKKPGTDVDKIVCLAYYLSHYRGTELFKTVDLSKLNSEAAQLKFSNAAQAVDNASKAGLLIAAQRGLKKISAIGELYVMALPDKVAAREAISHSKPRRRKTSGQQHRK